MKYSQPKVMHYTDKRNNIIFYIYYSFRHPADLKMKSFRVRSGEKFGVVLDINNMSNRISYRKELANELRSVVLEALKNGFSPFDDRSLNGLLSSKKNMFDVLRECIREKIQEGIASETVESYENAVNQVFKFINALGFANITIDLFDANMAARFLDYHAKGKTNTTYNHYLVHVRTIFSKAVEMGYISKNPFSFIKKRKAVVELNRAYTTEQARVILNAIKEKEAKLYLCCMIEYYAALRPNEIWSLKRCNLDFDRRLILLKAFDSKGKSLESVPMNIVLYNLLRCFEHLKDDDFLFSINGKQVNNGYFKCRFQRLKKQGVINIPAGCTLYSFKHSGLSDLYRKTKDVYLIKRIARHKSIETTIKYLRSIGEDVNGDNLDCMEEL